jgi:hypothetical protein
MLHTKSSINGNFKQKLLLLTNPLDTANSQRQSFAKLRVAMVLRLVLL